jgi:hypothetical protein
LQLGLAAADQLAGLDTGSLGLMLTPGNPCYLLLLGTLAWWLLAPYNEAANYLFYTDARTRYEGLDMWFRIEQHFKVRTPAPTVVLHKPVVEQLDAEEQEAGAPSRSGLPSLGPGAWLLALGAILLAGLPMAAQDVRARQERISLEKARREVAALKEKMVSAQPYPGPAPWRDHLRRIGGQLDPNSDSRQGRYRWIFEAADELGKGDQKADVAVVESLERRLRALEESLSRPPASPPKLDQELTPAKIRDLVPPLKNRTKTLQTAPKKKEPEPIKKEEDIDQVPVVNHRPGGAVLAPVSVGAGAVQGLLLVLIVLIVLVVLAGVVLLVVQLVRHRQRSPLKAQGRTERRAEDYLENPDQENVPGLWKRADELARAGNFLDALRTLYLAVLAMLHQSHLIRYERTRTNGEYADQLRPRLPLHELFLRLTGVFEIKWYGERACASNDFQTCRDLAERLQQQTRAASE